MTVTGELRIGCYLISHCEHGGVWIHTIDEGGLGEGGQFSAEDLESLIAKFFADKF